jgi:glucan phosphoethanolaminetransferase (alkaline phosphatase superfamily)
MKAAAGFCMFAVSYAVLNWFLLTQSVLYRFAVSDYWNAGIRGGALAFQALCLLGAIIFLPRRGFALILPFMFASAWLNLGYGLILHQIIDQSQLSWLVSETAQASASAHEFAKPVIFGLLLTVVGVALLITTRNVLRPAIAGVRNATLIGCLSLILPVLALDIPGNGPAAAERSAYVYLVQMAFAEPPPARAIVSAVTVAPPVAEKIVWLIDESIAYTAFEKLVSPMVKPFNPIDFGEVHSIGNCSGPSNVALRSGVDVVHATAKLDLRRTASIWGYAHKAGFRTTLFDGQSEGPLQNWLLAPERALIDQYEPSKHGLKTDLLLAKRINAMLRKPGPDFIYVVLHGAHFQYRDNYPKDFVPESSPIEYKYETAVRYSKEGFFPALLTGVDRSKIVVFYTSDHGQNIAPNVLPHCSFVPDDKEFSVPLIAFLPPKIRDQFKASGTGPKSHSQIFPTSLLLMGYATADANAYDANLAQASKRIIWFGRKVTPLADGDDIELHIVLKDRPPRLKE